MAEAKDGNSLASAWSKANPFNGYYLTPVEFFVASTQSQSSSDEAKWLQDKDGVGRKVMASGMHAILSDIKDVGKIRQRYPIFPLHDAGNTVWKELKALQDELNIFELEAGGLTLQLVGADHRHQIT